MRVLLTRINESLSKCFTKVSTELVVARRIKAFHKIWMRIVVSQGRINQTQQKHWNKQVVSSVLVGHSNIQDYYYNILSRDNRDIQETKRLSKCAIPINDWVRPNKGFSVPPPPLQPPTSPQKWAYRMQPFGITVGGPTLWLGATDKLMMLTMLGWMPCGHHPTFDGRGPLIEDNLW